MFRNYEDRVQILFGWKAFAYTCRDGGTRNTRRFCIARGNALSQCCVRSLHFPAGMGVLCHRDPQRPFLFETRKNGRSPPKTQATFVMRSDHRSTNINGIELFYTVTGDGEPLILLHAGVSSHMMWDAFIPLLAENHRVYALDMRGHGRSEYDSRGISYPLLADDLAEFIRILDLGRPHAIGYSSGGNVALDFAVRYPAVPASVTIAAAWLRIVPSMREAVRRIGIVSRGVVDFDTVNATLGHLVGIWEVEHSTRYGADHRKRLFETMAEMDLTPHGNHGEALRKIICPALIMAADRDGLIPLDQTMEQFEQIPRAELLVVPGTNHFTALGNVKWLAQAMLDFIARHSTKQAM